MKNLITLLLLAFSVIHASNHSAIKMDARLRKLVTPGLCAPWQAPLQKTVPESVEIIIRGTNCGNAVREAGGIIKTDLENYATARISMENLRTLLMDDRISRIQLSRRLKLYNNEMIRHVKADLVHAGASPLLQSYTGKNVIIGIIDTGIDIGHEDFQNPDGTTRILALWDQKQTPSVNPPKGNGYDYGYGREWTAQEINNGSCTHKDTDGHGTHVAGIAAGNGLAVNNFKGVAPDADLIIVAVDDENSTSLIEAADYIFKKADALDQSCVVNASIGTQEGPHDGSDLESEAMDAILAGKPEGRAICVSAGNEGDQRLHMGYTNASPPRWTYVYPGPDGLILIYVRIPNEQLNDVKLAVGADESDYQPEHETGGVLTYLGQTDWFTCQAIIDSNGKYVRIKTQGVDHGRISFEVDAQNDSITTMLVTIEDDMEWDEAAQEVTNMELWRFMVDGQISRVHAWVAEIGATFPEIPNALDYQAPDNYYSVIAPAVAYNVIAVGASVNRLTFENAEGELMLVPGELEIGDLADFSSRGPAADERVKPDIIAPGDGVISAMSAWFVNSENYMPNRVAPGGRHVIDSGTSMSSPVVAGCIALYMERFPTATFREIYTMMTQSATRDDQTGNALPNADWGYGKMNIFSMLNQTPTPVFTDMPVPIQIRLSQNTPNPFNPDTRIKYQLAGHGWVRLNICNTLGQVIATPVNQYHQSGAYTVSVNASDWPDGVYIYTLHAGRDMLIKKMLLIK